MKYLSQLTCKENRFILDHDPGGSSPRWVAPCLGTLATHHSRTRCRANCVCGKPESKKKDWETGSHIPFLSTPPRPQGPISKVHASSQQHHPGIQPLPSGAVNIQATRPHVPDVDMRVFSWAFRHPASVWSHVPTRHSWCCLNLQYWVRGTFFPSSLAFRQLTCILRYLITLPSWNLSYICVTSEMLSILMWVGAGKNNLYSQIIFIILSIWQMWNSSSRVLFPSTL
jgi:hypothetical protein